MNRVDLEQLVLGGLLLESSLVDEVGAVIEAQDFGQPDYRAVFGSIVKLCRAGGKADFVTVAGDLQRAGMDNALAFVGGIATSALSAANVVAYAEMLREEAAQDRLKALFMTLANQAKERSAAESVAAAMAALGDVQTVRTGTSTFAECVGSALAFSDKARQMRNEGGNAGIPFGLDELDRRTGGAQSGELIGVAARTSIGKTAMLNQMAVLAAWNNRPGLIVTMEEDNASLAMRAIANHTGKNVTKIRLGYDPDAQQALDEAYTSGLATIPLWVSHDDRLPAIISRITELRRREKIEFAIVDHVGLVRVDGIRERHLQVGEVTRQLKLLAMRLGIPIIIAVQLNREAEKAKPALSHLRESGNIEQDLNTAIFIHAPEVPDTGNIDCELGILKNRYGKRGWIKNKFEFDGTTQRFMQTT